MKGLHNDRIQTDIGDYITKFSIIILNYKFWFSKKYEINRI